MLQYVICSGIVLVSLSHIQACYSMIVSAQSVLGSTAII